MCNMTSELLMPNTGTQEVKLKLSRVWIAMALTLYKGCVIMLTGSAVSIVTGDT